MLEIKNLHASVEGKEILKGVNLTIGDGEVHVLMGPNGSGKSTLSHVLVGNPKYTVTEGSITFNGKDLPGGKSVFTVRFEVKDVSELEVIRNKLLNIRDVVGSRTGQN